MEIDIIKIGNSKGIRIPKAILEQCGLCDHVTLSVRDNEIILSASPRAEWRSAFAAMAEAGDDRLLDPNTATDFDTQEWSWE